MPGVEEYAPFPKFVGMAKKRLPDWDAAAAADLCAECFPDAAERAVVERAVERLAAAVHALHGVDPEAHLDLFDGAALDAEWRVTVENVSTGERKVVSGKVAGEMAWFLDEMWQDAPLAMSPVRYQRLAFRILEEHAWAVLQARGAAPMPEAFGEFVGDLLTLLMGPHHNHYVFGWWREHHGRFRKG